MNLAPITESPGITLMMKMGWSSGQGLGKEGTGDVNPLQLAVKTDRKGTDFFVITLFLYCCFLSFLKLTLIDLGIKGSLWGT